MELAKLLMAQVIKWPHFLSKQLSFCFVNNSTTFCQTQISISWWFSLALIYIYICNSLNVDDFFSFSPELTKHVKLQQSRVIKFQALSKSTGL